MHEFTVIHNPRPGWCIMPERRWLAGPLDEAARRTTTSLLTSLNGSA